MAGHKFNPEKLDKLNDPTRVALIDFTKIMPALHVQKDSLLIDIGVGTGIFAEKFLEMIPDAHCKGFDVEPIMIDWMNEHRVPKWPNRLEAILMEENHIPLEDGVADFAMMITVHHEMADSRTQLKDIHRVLKSSGQILICDWKEGAHHHFVKKQEIIDDLIAAGFSDLQEIEASERLVCIVAKA